MGNISSMNSRDPVRRSSEPASPGLPLSSQQPTNDHTITHFYSPRSNLTGGRIGRGHGLSILHLSRSRSEEQPQQERVRETKQEKEARRTERERKARLREREISMRKEHVDGGYLVTQGIYIGPEDYSKAVVRQLQVGLSMEFRGSRMDVELTIRRLNEDWLRSGKA